MRATALLLAAAGVAPAADDAAKLEFFEKKVRPVLAGHCAACHSAETKPAGGLRVDDRNGLLTGGNTGAAVVPGKPDAGMLLKRIAKEAKRRMPLEGEPLTDAEIADVTKWVADGAVWPAPKFPASLGKQREKYEELRKDHWAFQPAKAPAVPKVRDAAWPADPVDAFVLAKLEAKTLKPVGDAAKGDLIRRVTFDLTGLPPTPAEVDAFLADESPKAFEKLVDRLLASKQFGEHWGRHWLDVARYGESTGPSRNIPYPHAWKYRDYVIESVNADVPYDRFLTEQIAGDLIAAKDGTERDRLLVATGFLALGVKDVNQRFKVRFVMDNVDEQIDAVTRSTLALTVSCARCHDHKFDPIPTADYYALAGIFTSTDNCAGVRNQMGGAGLAYYVPDQLVKLGSKVELPAVSPEKLAKLKAGVADAKAKWDAIRGTPEGQKKAANGQPTQRPFRLKYEALQAELNGLTDPAQQGAAAHGVRDAKAPADTEIRLRGEAEKLGPVAPRGFLTAFEVPGAKPINPAESGRRELAAWIANPNNPLTARVAVNRLWQHLFGRGLVGTADNFGVTGDNPSHPELLDYLAQRFVADGWSTKKLVRALVLSRTYRLSADATAAHKAVDPGNTLLWRHAPRRLSAEEVRDAALAAAGTLDHARPATTPVQTLPMREIRDNGPEAKAVHETADASHVRSVYLPLLRGLTPHALEPFDPVDQTLVSAARESTTVPTQSLFLLNSAFVRTHSLALAEKLLATKTDESAKVEDAYRRVLGRRPTAAEVNRAKAFLGEYESAYRQQPQPVAKKAAPPKSEAPKNAVPVVDPDQEDTTGVAVTEASVAAKDAHTAAWLAFVQALYGSAEFRFLK